jgi:hypothetical protein
VAGAYSFCDTQSGARGFRDGGRGDEKLSADRIFWKPAFAWRRMGWNSRHPCFTTIPTHALHGRQS